MLHFISVYTLLPCYMAYWISWLLNVEKFKSLYPNIESEEETSLIVKSIHIAFTPF